MHFIQIIILILIVFSPDSIKKEKERRMESEPFSPNSIMIENGPQTIIVGETFDFNALLMNETGVVSENEVISWTTSNKEIAEINENGMMRGKLTGEILVFASFQSGDQTLKDSVPVKIRCNNLIDVSPSAIMNYTDRSVLLNISSGDHNKLTFQSTNTNVAQVNQDGVVTLIEQGECSILIRTECGKCLKEIPVIVI